MQKEISTRYIYTRENGDYFVSLPTALNRRVRDFRAADYGSHEKARKAAVAWRDRHLPVTQRNLTLRQGKTGQRLLGMADGRATSMGKLGVSPIWDGPAKRPARFRAEIRVAGEKSTRTQAFSIREHGFDDALLYAIRKRLAWERQYLGHVSQLADADWLEFAKLVIARHGYAKIRPTDVHAPGSLSYPDETGVQTRITVAGKSYSKWFAYRQYSLQGEAHVAAILWCVRTRHQYNPGGRKRIRSASKRNRTTGVAGVSRYVSKDRRGKPVVVYSVSSQVNGRSRPINFVVGREAVVTPQQEQFTLDIATRCRQAFERSWDAGEPFDPSPWKGWKKKYSFAAV